MSLNWVGKSRCVLVLSCLCSVGLTLSMLPLNSAVIPAAAAQSGSSFKMRVDVELVTAEIVVLDKKGKPVRGLKKENFRIYEDGKEQEILSFDEVNDESGAASLGIGAMNEGDNHRGKTVLIVFDDSTITAAHLKTSRDSAARFVREHMRPQDIFAVASFGLSMRVLQNFTSDREEVLAAIAQPAVSNAVPSVQTSPTADQNSRQMQGQRTPDISTMSAGYQLENLLRSLERLGYSVERLKGSKSVLIYSESTYFNANITQTTYRDALNSAKRSNVIFYTVNPAGLNPQGSVQVREPVKNRASSAGSVRSGFSYGQLLTAGNSMFQKGGGQTGGGTGSGTGGGTGGGSGGGTGSGSGGSTGGASGGTTGSSSSFPGSTAPDYNRSNPDYNRPFDNPSSSSLQGSMSILRSLAVESGGLAIYDTNDFDSELDKLDQQLSNYYILGFQSSNAKHDGAFRKLEVKTELKGVALRHKTGYLDRRPIDVLASSKQEKTLLTTLASATPAAQLPIIFRPLYFYDSPRIARVLVSAKIRMEKTTLKKKGSQIGTDVYVMGVAYSEDGSISARFSETVPIAFDKDREQNFRKGNLAYRNYFRLRPGKYRLKIAASDEGNNLGSAEQSFEVPAFPEKGPALSSIVMADRISRLPDLIQKLQTQMLDESDPLVYSGMQIDPGVENKVALNTTIPVLFRIYNLAGSPEQWKLAAKARLVNEKGEEKALPTMALKDIASAAGSAEAVVGLILNFENMSPGKYKLVIDAGDTRQPEIATAQTELEFVKKAAAE
jgi:VWFA-related protein